MGIRIYNAVEVGSEGNMRVFYVCNIDELKANKYLDPVITATHNGGLSEDETTVIGALIMNGPIALIHSCIDLVEFNEASWITDDLKYEGLLQSVKLNRTNGGYETSLMGFTKPEVTYAKVFTRALCTSLLGQT